MRFVEDVVDAARKEVSEGTDSLKGEVVDGLDRCAICGRRIYQQFDFESSLRADVSESSGTQEHLPVRPDAFD
jgi:hypothetical protein